MASAGTPEPGAPVAVPQICPHCQKSFPRLCDLNKHAKSHSRPFKCSVTTCKYHQHGWPTAKELERHVNDKHSAAPRTYACTFESCTYESKRESNCKQHMEKKHGWEYIRSKSNGKRPPPPRQGIMTPLAMGAAPGPTPQQPTGLRAPGEAGIQANPLPPKPPLGHQFESDFILYPDPHDQSIPLGHPDEDLPHGYQDVEDDESRVFIPWTSPTTRMLNNQSVLDSFAERYNRPFEKDMIDPSLQHFDDASITNWPKFASEKPPAIDTSVKTEPPGLGLDRFSWNGGSDTGSAPDDSPSERRNPSTAYSSQYHTPHSAAVDFTGTPAHPGQMGWNKPPSRRRGSDEDSQRPEKKLKSSPTEEFTDNNMPDIFRYAHPSIYDRDQKEKYSPCHSSHRDISTLVRHLGRPAHRLTVTKEAISSFDIDDEDYLHPRVGVCRRCWRQFSDREAFEEHASASCDKVSKGKREKWQILHDSFTPLLDVAAARAAAANNRVETLLSFADSSMHDESAHSSGPTFLSAGPPWSQPPVSPVASIPSLVSYFPRRPNLPASGPNDTVVWAQEFERVQKENDDLRAELQRARAGQGFPLHSGDSSGSIPPIAGAASRRTASTRDAQIASPDRDSLVLHMGSKPEEVDVQGLMNEPQENLSRTNSDMSSGSRSTIHHVTTSPPQRLVEYEEADCSKGGDPHKTATPHRPCPSIPDSGYSSAGHRRFGSFGDIGHMPGDVHHGHQRTFSNFPAVPYQQPGKQTTAIITGGPDEVFQNPNVSWRPTPFAAPTSVPAQQGTTGQYQQAQPTHTFPPGGQAPAQGDTIDDFFQDIFENLS